MAELVWFLLGGVFWTYLFGRLIGHLAFRESPPDPKAMYGAIGAFVLICIAASFGLNNPVAGLFYVPGSFIGFYLLRKDYRKAWIGVEQTFD